MVINDETKLRLAHYDGSDGPHVVLFGPLQTDLGSLRRCFLELSKGGLEIALDSLPFVYSVGVRLRLRSLGKRFKVKGEDSRHGLRRQLSDDPSFVWNLTQEEWECVSELLDSLIHCQDSGHQYLTQNPYDDATVVVSKGEYGDEVIDPSHCPRIFS